MLLYYVTMSYICSTQALWWSIDCNVCTGRRTHNSKSLQSYSVLTSSTAQGSGGSLKVPRMICHFLSRSLETILRCRSKLGNVSQVLQNIPPPTSRDSFRGVCWLSFRVASKMGSRIMGYPKANCSNFFNWSHHWTKSILYQSHPETLRVDILSEC